MATLKDAMVAYLLVIFLINLSNNLPSAYWAIYLSETGLTLYEIGILQALYFLSVAFLDFPTGNIADKFGRRLSGAIGSMLYGLSLIIVSVTRQFSIFIFASFLGGLGTALVSGSYEAWVTDEFKARNEFNKLKQVFSFGRSLGTCAAVFAGIISSILALSKTSLPIAMGGLVGILAGIVSIILMKENYGERRGSFIRLFILNIKRFFYSKEIMFFTLANLGLNSSIVFFFISWQILLTSRGYPSEFLGALYSVLVIAMTLGSMLSAFLMKKISDYRLLAITSVGLGACFMAIMGTFDSVVMSVFVMIAFELTLGLQTPVLIFWRNTLIPSSSRASILSGMSTIISLSNAVMLIVLGKTTRILGVDGTYLVMSFLYAVSFVSFLVIAKRITGSSNYEAL